MNSPVLVTFGKFDQIFFITAHFTHSTRAKSSSLASSVMHFASSAAVNFLAIAQHGWILNVNEKMVPEFRRAVNSFHLPDACMHTRAYDGLIIPKSHDSALLYLI